MKLFWQEIEFCFQSFSNGAAFYLATGKEMVSDARKMVLKHKETGEYIDNFSSTKNRGSFSNTFRWLYLDP